MKKRAERFAREILKQLPPRQGAVSSPGRDHRVTETPAAKIEELQTAAAITTSHGGLQQAIETRGQNIGRAQPGWQDNRRDAHDTPPAERQENAPKQPVQTRPLQDAIQLPNATISNRLLPPEEVLSVRSSNQRMYEPKTSATLNPPSANLQAAELRTETAKGTLHSGALSAEQEARQPPVAQRASEPAKTKTTAHSAAQSRSGVYAAATHTLTTATEEPRAAPGTEPKRVTDVWPRTEARELPAENRSPKFLNVTAEAEPAAGHRQSVTLSSAGITPLNAAQQVQLPAPHSAPRAERQSLTEDPAQNTGKAESFWTTVKPAAPEEIAHTIPNAAPPSGIEQRANWQKAAAAELQADMQGYAHAAGQRTQEGTGRPAPPLSSGWDRKEIRQQPEQRYEYSHSQLTQVERFIEAQFNSFSQLPDEERFEQGDSERAERQRIKAAQRKRLKKRQLKKAEIEKRIKLLLRQLMQAAGQKQEQEMKLLLTAGIAEVAEVEEEVEWQPGEKDSGSKESPVPVTITKAELYRRLMAGVADLKAQEPPPETKRPSTGSRAEAFRKLTKK